LPLLEVCPEPSNSSMLCTEGSSLMPLIEDPERSDWKSAVFWQYPRGSSITDHLKGTMGYSMRTADWRYTEWVGITYLGDNAYLPDWENAVDWPELYSMVEDPGENVNLARVGEYKEVVEQLSQQLRAGWRAFRPKEA